VFEMSRLLRGNLMAHHPLIDRRVMTYLAYRRRIHQTQSPITSSFESLWQEGRRALADF